MKKFFYTIAGLILALGYVAPFSVQAQTNTAHLCFYPDPYGNPYVVYATRSLNGAYTCPVPQAGQPLYTALDTDLGVNESVLAVCWVQNSPSSYDIAAAKTATTSGDPNCPVGNPPVNWQGKILKSQFSTSPPTGGSTNGNTNNQTNRPTNKPPTSNGNGNSPTGGSTDADCSDANFHSVGPLCIPNNPFANSNSIASSGSITDLAVKVIKALLFFAGIVAVVMIIIGGYLYMTARGNDLQATNGRKTLTNAIIGLAIIVLAYVIVQAVYNFLAK